MIFRATKFTVLALLGLVTVVGTNCDSLNTGGDGPLVPKLPSGVFAVDSDATGSNTGATWKNAITDLHAALDSAQAGDEVWIAAGTYVPTEPRSPGDDRTATFEIPAGVEVYGGFAGDERKRDARNPEDNTTILSGDRGVGGDAADNSYHVVTTRGDAETVIDGVTITGGNADGGQQPENLGGGIYNESGHLRVIDVKVRANAAQYGGGLFDSTGHSTLNTVVFQDNVSYQSGAGVYVDESAVVEGTEVFFVENEAGTGGGGVFNEGTARFGTGLFKANRANGPISAGFGGDGGGLASVRGRLSLRSIEFVSNQANDAGGGLLVFVGQAKRQSRAKNHRFEYQARVRTHAQSLSSVQSAGFIGTDDGALLQRLRKEVLDPALEDLTFEENQAAWGGGIFNQNADFNAREITLMKNRADSSGGGLFNRGSGAHYQDIDFQNNEAGKYGGGLYNLRSGGTVVDARFEGNVAGEFGGGADNVLGNVTYVNALFFGNEAQMKGGALAGRGGDYTLRNITVVENTALDGGDAMISTDGQPSIVNSIFWGNGATSTEEIVTVQAQPTFHHSILRGSGGSGNWNSSYGEDGGGNLDRRPEFGSISANGLRLTQTSPAVDAGTSFDPSIERFDSSDLADNPRVVDGDGDASTTIDMGSYEYQ